MASQFYKVLDDYDFE